MTVAIAVAISDGVILASDSASTTREQNGRTFIHHHKQKVFPLHDSLPVGLVTSGLNRIGAEGVATLCRDLKSMLSGRMRKDDGDWALNPDEYTLKDVFERVRRYLFEEHYLPQFDKLPKENRISFFIGGFGAKDRFPAISEIQFKGQHMTGPDVLQAQRSAHVKFGGVAEATHRLMSGFAPQFPGILEKSGIEKEKITKIINSARGALFPPILHPHMPLKEAVEVVRFLTETEIRFAWFTPEPDTVGGAVQLASITRHQGFQWVAKG